MRSRGKTLILVPLADIYEYLLCARPFFFFFNLNKASHLIFPKGVDAIIITLFIGKERKAQSQALNPGHLLSWLKLLSALHERGAADTVSLKPARLAE